MRIARSIAAVAALSLVVASPALAQDTVETTATAVADGPVSSYIVQFTPGSDRAAEVSKAKGLGMKVNAEYRYAISGMSVEANAGQLRALQANPNVKLVEKDAIATVLADQSGATWGLDRVDQRDLPLNGIYSYSQTASTVTAYVVDTGILASHTEFGGRVRAGFDAVTAGGTATDCDGHGTHVAGTIGGTTYGLAKAVTLVPVRVLGCTGSGTTTDILEGIDYVIADHAAGTPAVANFSLGYSGIVSSVDDAMARLVADGVTVVIAAGNSNVDACGVTPARTPSAVTVGATTSTDARSSFSNFGSCLDIFAPGSSITSAWFTSSTATNTISGTSMAAPHVAGAAALYLASDPTASPATVTSALTSAATASKVTSPGTGSPNRLLFVGAATPPPPVAAPTISSFSPSAGYRGSAVTVTGTGLAGATATVNGVAATVTASSATSLTLTVPSTATTGRITVTNSAGSATSALDFQVLVATAPSAPTNVTATSPSNGRATVRWTLSTNNGGSPITSQTVVAYRISGTPQRTTYTVSATATTVTLSLTRRAQYQFAVIANNAAGPSIESGRSGTVTIR